jgi:hypothetical protein
MVSPIGDAGDLPYEAPLFETLTSFPRRRICEIFAVPLCEFVAAQQLLTSSHSCKNPNSLPDRSLDRDPLPVLAPLLYLVEVAAVGIEWIVFGGQRSVAIGRIAKH